MGGGLLHPKKLTAEEQSNFAFLRSSNYRLCPVQLTKIVECFVYYHKNYANFQLINFDQFDDIFSPILNDSSIVFQRIKPDFSQKVSFYEAIASLMLFCTGDFYDKAKYLAHMFDLNGDLIMQLDQFQLFMKSALNGICKIRGSTIVPQLQMNSKLITLFNRLDKEQKQEITFEQFEQFMRTDDEVQAFLFNFTGKQTFQQASKVTRDLFQKYTKIFKDNSFNFLDQDFCSMGALMKKLQPQLLKEGVSSQDLKRLMQLLDCEEKGAVSEQDFRAIMKPWAVYTACDFQNTGAIQASELKQMIWLVDEKEPPQYRVQKERQLLNLDDLPTIPRYHWIKYLACIDPSAGFNFSMKRNFDMFDFNKDGLINMTELTMMIKRTLDDISTGKTQKQKKMMDELVKSLASDIMKKLDPANRGGLDWSSFKMYMHYASEKESKLKDFIDNYC